MKTPYRRRMPVSKEKFGILAVFVFAISLVGCGSEVEADKRYNSAQTTKGSSQFVRLEGDVVEEFGLEISPVGPAVIEETITLTGEIRVNEDRLAHIVPRFGGIVTEARKQIGDHVSSGETLAVIESSRSLTAYSLKAMLDGLIIEKHATQGEAVGNDTEAFVVADLSTVWVDLDVRLGDLPRVRAGQAVRIKSIHGTESANGLISYVTPLVDERTRTATARVVLKNESGFWRPGMFAVAELTLERAEVLSAVPKSAIHSLGKETVVFIVDDEGFRPRLVQVGLRDEHNAEVRGDIAPGEEVVVVGGFTVKSELIRKHLADDHGR